MKLAFSSFFYIFSSHSGFYLLNCREKNWNTEKFYEQFQKPYKNLLLVHAYLASFKDLQNVLFTLYSLRSIFKLINDCYY